MSTLQHSSSFFVKITGSTPPALPLGGRTRPRHPSSWAYLSVDDHGHGREVISMGMGWSRTTIPTRGDFVTIEDYAEDYERLAEPSGNEASLAPSLRAMKRIR